MTSYLSNQDAHTSGAQIAEFDDAPPARDARQDVPPAVADAARDEMAIPADETDEG
jgi:hypothetical protein